MNNSKITKIGQVFFLAGVSLLIIRNNAYPWPIKRASDIFFFISFLCIGIFLFKYRQWNSFIVNSKPAIKGVIIITIGLVIGSMINVLVFNRNIENDGLLTIFRFFECFGLLLAIGFFQSKDDFFYRKVAYAQLSTLVYVATFIIPNQLYKTQYRFQLFENWPSNVSYYVIVSLIFLSSILWSGQYNKKIKIAGIVVGSIGLGAILLWTASRASWMSFFIVVSVLIILKMRQLNKKFLLAIKMSTVYFLFVISSFFILPTHIKNEVVRRIFPGVNAFIEQKYSNSTPVVPKEILELITTQKIPPNLYEASRPELWNIYAHTVVKQPLGFGVNAPVITYEGTFRGPHNTILEILLLGGLIGLLGYGYIMYLSIRRVIVEAWRTHNLWPLYISLSILALFVTSQFDDMITFRLMWVLFGLGIYFPIIKDKKTQNNTN